jgi:hypothetical protein
MNRFGVASSRGAAGAAASPQTPASFAAERAAASSSADDPDPDAIINRILEQRAATQRGQ